MNRFILNLLCLLAFAVATQAQAQDSSAAKPAKPAPTTRAEAKANAKNLALAKSTALAALTPEQLAIAERVYVGKLPCEQGAFVTLNPDPKNPGYFQVEVQKTHYHMFPVATSTGAVRLEDQKAGAVWLQLANKSMLMNQKLGKRMADECKSPAQEAVAQALQTNPAASVLDAPKPEAPAKP